jgi:hypothetical protein
MPFLCKAVAVSCASGASRSGVPAGISAIAATGWLVLPVNAITKPTGGSL